MKKRLVVATIVEFISCSGCFQSRLSRAKLALLNADLALAACNGDIQKVENLLNRGADVNATGGLGSSALIDAEGCGYHDRQTKSRVQLIELLIAKGAEVNHTD